MILVSKIDITVAKSELKAPTHPTRLAAQYRDVTDAFVLFSVCHVTTLSVV